MLLFGVAVMLVAAAEGLHRHLTALGEEIELLRGDLVDAQVEAFFRSHELEHAHEELKELKGKANGN